MKTNILIICSLLLLLASCGDFLEYQDKDKVIPNKIEHYEELIYGELLLKDAGGALVNLDLMTDDVESYVKDEIGTWDTDKREDYFGYYSWAKDPQYDLRGNEKPDKAWEHFYHKVLMCNIIEHDVNELEDDLTGMKERLLGEVRFIRALAYFYLVNMYGAPYESASQAQTAMGVPINREVGVYDKLYTRATLQEVYTLIEEDLLAAKKNFENGEDKKTIFRPNLHATNILLSRVYLYEKRWSDAILAATDAINHSGAAIEPIDKLEACEHLYYRKNAGIVFSWGDGDNGPVYADNSYAGRYIVARELQQGYVENDVRLTGFFKSFQTTLYSKKTNGDEIYRWAFRIEEAWLNRAEAYIELGQEWQKGVDDVNALRSNRVKDFTNETFASQTDALAYCRQERRLELCFEDLRWFDIRRWGLEVVHRYESFPEKQDVREFRLEKNSPNYILPIPLDEQEINQYIERPARIDCEVK